MNPNEPTTFDEIAGLLQAAHERYLFHANGNEAHDPRVRFLAVAATALRDPMLADALLRADHDLYDKRHHVTHEAAPQINVTPRLEELESRTEAEDGLPF